MEKMPSPEMQSFFAWFQSHNGYIDTSAMDVVDFPLSEGGRGAIALTDIPANHTVFSVPRALVLSPRTSTLPAKMGASAWKKFGLHKGWAGLILCMMWEASRGEESLWGPYFDTLPTQFDTPMFWSEQELQELKGTSVVDKLGKDEAENEYTTKVLPAIQSRPDLFATNDADTMNTRFSLAVFHMMGTRISSRSFTLMKDEEGDAEDDGEEEEGESTTHDHDHDHGEQDQDRDVGNTSMGSAMDVDEPSEENEDDGEEDEEEEEDDGTEVAMVPLADILNARYKTENVKLFYEPDALKMVSTREIKAGEQIWNTYGDLPNAELLRGYGHVDYLPLHPSFSFSHSFSSSFSLCERQKNTETQHEKGHQQGQQQQEYGNPGDTVDVRADLVVRCVLDAMGGGDGGGGDAMVDAHDGDVEERIDWWLEEGGDDVFTLEHPSLSLSLSENEQEHGPSSSSNAPQPKRKIEEDLTTVLTPALLSFIRLIQMSSQEWDKAKKKGKPPKPVPGDRNVLDIVLDVVERRAGEYVGDLEEDRRVVAQPQPQPGEGIMLDTRRRNALVVRLGERRVLDGVRRYVEGAVEALAVFEAEEREKEKEKSKHVDKGKVKEKEEKEKPKTMSRAEKRKAGKDLDDDGWDVGEKEKGGRKRRK